MSIPGRRELARRDPPRGQVEAPDQAVIVHDVLLIAGRWALAACATLRGTGQPRTGPARRGAAMADEACSRRPAVATRYGKRGCMYQAAVDLAPMRICGYETPVA